MDITINENLKRFRRERGNTQEELANHLGISVQAVSKWERNEGYPDITLLPAIASYYDTTVDDLLGCSEIEKNRKIEEIMQQCRANGNVGKIEDNITLLRDALREFPNNLSLMVELAHYLLFTNKDKYIDECIELGEKVLAKSVDDAQRYSVLQILTYAFNSKSDKTKAKEYAEKLPNIYYTRDILLESVLEGEEGLKIAQNNIERFIGLIDSSVLCMLQSKEYTPEEKIFAYETVEKLYKLFYYDENYGFEHSSLYMLRTNIAKEYAKCKNKEKTINALKTAYYHACEMDNFKPGKYTSIFMSSISYAK